MSDDDLITTWGLLSEATVAVSRQLAAGLSAVGSVTLAEFDVLIRLYREPDHRLALATIARDVGLTIFGLGKLINRAELDYLLITSSDHAAPCTIYATLTDHGTEQVALALRHHTADLRRHVLAPIGVHGLGALAELTRALRDSNSASDPM